MHKLYKAHSLDPVLTYPGLYPLGTTLVRILNASVLITAVLTPAGLQVIHHSELYDKMCKTLLLASSCVQLG